MVLSGQMLVCLLGISLLSLTAASGLESSTFEHRLNMYAQWADQIQHQGRSLASAPAPAPTSGVCKVLRFATGFADLTSKISVTIKDTPNFGECCKACSEDPLCKGWTRVAGGDPKNFRNCYLKYNIPDIDPALVPTTHIGHTLDDVKYPELRYADVDFPSKDFPVILESGTKDDIYPSEYYGCPYSPVATTPCPAPATCNMNGNGQFVAPACIE